MGRVSSFIADVVMWGAAAARQPGGIGNAMESAGSPTVWAPWLEALPPDTAPALVPLLDRLASRLDPLAAAAAGSGSLALFDAGPGQLGGPRVAQIAILLVLARRAATAGARFAWGTLQETEAPLSPGAGADACRRLVEARTPHEATAAQIAAWRLRLEERAEWDEVWVVGSPRLGAPPDLPGALHLQLWDTLDLDARQVGVSLSRGERREETRLDLPDDAVCVRLMRLGGALRRTEERDLLPAPAPGARDAAWTAVGA